MKSRMVSGIVGPILLLILCSVSTVSAGEPLPIMQGQFVESDMDCDSAPFRYFVNYNGKGFDYNRSWCTIIKVSNKANRYFITEECDHYPLGEGGSSTHKRTVVIKNKTSFTLIDGKRETAYKYCK